MDEGGVAGVAVEDAVVVSSDGGGVRQVVVDKLRQQFVNKRNVRVVGIVLLIQKQDRQIFFFFKSITLVEFSILLYIQCLKEVL